MPPRISDLVDDPVLGLSVLAGAASLHRPIRWVATSEHEDPTPFLQGGELLLVTGLRLPRSRSAMTAYVQRLVAAGVVGLGFGVGLVQERTPAVLVDAAEGAGLVLLEVPEPTPFVAVSKKVSDLLAADEVTQMAWANKAQQDLTRTAVREGSRAVIRMVSRLLDAWVAELDGDGHTIHAHPRSAQAAIRRSATQLQRIRERGLAAASLADGQEHLSVHQLGTGTSGRGQLVIGSSRALTVPERSLVTVAAALLSFGRDVALGGDAEKRRSAVLDLARRGTVTDPDTLRLLGCPVLARSTLWAITAAGPVHARARWMEGLTSLGPERLATAARGPVHWVVVGSEPDLELARSLARAGTGVHLGVAGPADGSAELAVLFDRSDRALRWARERDLASAAYDDLVRGLSSVTRPEDAAAFARDLLAPLREHARSTGNELEPTLAVWLRHHGVFEPAAAELGVHRHTLRNRVARAEQVLGLDLGDVDVRMELWFALRTLHYV